MGPSKFRGMLDAFMDILQAETEFPLVIYDVKGCIIHATDKTRIGRHHPGVGNIGPGLSEAYSITAKEALKNPMAPEGCYCPLMVKGRTAAVLGIIGELALTKPIAKIASRMFNIWIEKINDKQMAVKEAERLESVLVQSQKMEAIGTLAGGIAHDFNNILSAIIGYAQLSLTDVEHNSRQQHNLNQILTAGMRARDLVNQILTFSRQQERELVPLQMEPLVKEALQLLRASLPSTIEIVQDIASGLDSVKADPTQIQQILMNLCTNAAQAMEAQGGRIMVRLEQVDLGPAHPNRLQGLQPGVYLRLSIQDNGPGIPEQVIDRIFHPFFTTKAKGKGTGLGLSVVHGIVKSLNGAVTAKNKSGQGCEFTVFIPAIKCRPATSRSIPAPWPNGDERVLLVDDEPCVMEIGQKTLERLGYKVTACNSSLEALEIFKKSPDDFDLVISDITMPKMTGDELAGRMLQINKDVPIILCTGFSDRFSADQIQAVGARAFLMKPVVPSDLAHTVRKVLKTKSKNKHSTDGRWIRCA